MRYTPLPFEPHRAVSDDGLSFTEALTRLGPSQRDSLFRGLTFVIVLTVSCLLLVYAPMAWEDPDWSAAGVTSLHLAATPPAIRRDRTSARD